MNSHNKARGFLRAVVVLLIVGTAPIQQVFGEFNISRYIEPNQMSNLFTRHVRKGIIRRIGLTEAQLHEIRNAIDPHREKLLVETAELKDARIRLFEAVADASFDPDLVRQAYADAMARELDLMLTIGAVLRDIRPILTDGQILEVAEMLEEIRAASEVRFADFSAKLAAGELLGLKNAPRDRK